MSAPCLRQTVKSFLVLAFCLLQTFDQVNLQGVRPVTGFNIYDINAPDSTCTPGQTYVNGRRVCKGQLIFQDYFTNGLNSSVWNHEIFLSESPDYEFVIYNNGPEISYQHSTASLSIKPTINTEEFINKKINLDSCTSSVPRQCSLNPNYWNIVPPINSARITTKNSFSFKYGIVEIHARLPEGDWLLPQLWLSPKSHEFGRDGNLTGQIRIAQARGNARLEDNGEDFSNKRLEKGIEFGIVEEDRKKINIVKVMKYSISKVPWTNDFHKFELEWTPEKFEFRVDNKVKSTLMPPRGGWTNIPELRRIDYLKTSDMSPFDEEFYLVLGLGVGGFRYFPKSVPWVHNAKYLHNFWQDREQWSQTWNQNSQLLIKKVEIWSI